MSRLCHFFADDPVDLERVYSETWAIQTIIFDLHHVYVERLQFYLGINPDVQGLSLDMAMYFFELYVQYLNVVSIMFDAVWHDDRDKQVETFESSAPLIAEIELRLNALAQLEIVFSDEVFFSNARHNSSYNIAPHLSRHPKHNPWSNLRMADVKDNIKINRRS